MGCILLGKGTVLERLVLRSRCVIAVVYGIRTGYSVQHDEYHVQVFDGCGVRRSSACLRTGEKTDFPTDKAVTVFSAGEGNPYASIRIPALLNIGKGQLLAFAEGRYKNTDQGRTTLS